MFDELADWDVTAQRDGQVQVAGAFRQTYPEDAVLVLVAVAGAKFDVHLIDWGLWSFHCTTTMPGGRVRSLLYVVSPSGKPMRLADSVQASLGQNSPNATA